MSAFDDINAAAQDWNEDVMGDAFSYQATSGGSTTSGLVGVFNQVDENYEFSDGSTRKLTSLICVTSKTQWTAASLTPVNRGVVTYGGITYQIDHIAGINTASEPAYSLTLRKLT